MTPQTPPSPLRTTDRSRARRRRERASVDRALADAVLDEGLVAHVATVTEHGPVVLPMAYARIDDHLYLHGAVANHLLRTLAAGAPVCVTVTLLDGLVLARSAFHHSVNYRCVVLFGVVEVVTDRDEKRAASAALVDHVVAGRGAEARPPTDAELASTLVVRLPVDEGSVKVRTGPPIDDEDDRDLPVWAGTVPVGTTFGDPLPDDGVTTPVPDGVAALSSVGRAPV